MQPEEAAATEAVTITQVDPEPETVPEATAPNPAPEAAPASTPAIVQAPHTPAETGMAPEPPAYR